MSTPSAQSWFLNNIFQLKEPRLWENDVLGLAQERIQDNLEQFMVKGSENYGTYRKNMGTNLKELLVVKAEMI